MKKMAAALSILCLGFAAACADVEEEPDMDDGFETTPDVIDDTPMMDTTMMDTTMMDTVPDTTGM